MELAVIGGIALDYLSRVKDASANVTQVLEYSENLGGMAYNTAMAAARLGADTALVSAVGPDFPKMGMTKNLRLSLTRSKAGTTRSFLFFDGKEERIYFYRGAYHDINVPKAKKEIGRADWVHFAGVAPCFAGLAKFAKAKGKEISFNPGYDLLHYRPEDGLVTALLENSDYTIMSSNELEYLGRTPDGLAKKATIVTRGSLGSTVYENGQQAKDIPAYFVEVRSPFGAGDAYSGTLIAGLMRKKSLLEAARLASAAGSFAVEERSTTPKLSWAKIEKRANRL